MLIISLTKIIFKQQMSLSIIILAAGQIKDELKPTQSTQLCWRLSHALSRVRFEL